MKKYLTTALAMGLNLHMFFGGKDTIGLDIGSSYLKVVQLKEKRGGYELDAFDMLPLPPELIVEGSIIDSLRLVDSIKELLKKARIKAKNCALGIAGHASVIIRRITLPEMSQEELSESIKFEAEQYVPFDIDDVNIDFQILGPTEEVGQMDVMLVAVKKDIINEYLSVVREAGLNPVVVDVNAFSLGNMYEINYEIEPDRNVALVNIGAGTINLNILKGGVSVFTRDSSLGSNIHAEALQKEFNLSFEAAERLKAGEAVEGVSEEQAHPVLAAASEELAGEIGRSLDYFRSTVFQEDVHEIVLSGGGALIRGFPELLAERVGLEVRLAEPFKNVNIPGKFDIAFIDDVSCMAAVAVGLAIRRAGDR
jgi:type IV pilus assembly protein PilM